MRKYLFLIPVLLMFVSNVVLAAGISINYDGYSAGEPLFNETNIKPGDTYSRTITVTNGNPVAENVGVKITSSTTGDLANAILITIRDGGTNQIIDLRSISGYISAGEIQLGTLAPSESKGYIFIANFDSNSGNEYQGLAETFDMSLGFIGTPAGPVIPTGTTGNPLTRLGAAIAGFLGFTTSTPTAIVAVPEVKGEVKNDNEVKGTEQPGSDVKACPWWFIVLIILALILLGIGAYFYNLKNDNRYPRTWFIWPILVGAGSWVLHRYLQDGYNPTWYCNWFWALILIELIIYFSFHYFVILRKNNSTE